jgi:hypothetical protein
LKLTSTWIGTKNLLKIVRADGKDKLAAPVIVTMATKQHLFCNHRDTVDRISDLLQIHTFNTTLCVD